MALSTDRLDLNNHEIFRKIREHLPPNQRKTKNLMVCNEDVLFVWDPVDECLLTMYLRTPDSGHQSYQTLVPQSPPNFAVERVRCSDTGRQVALIGPSGVAVLDLPRRWDLSGKFQAGSRACRCRTVLSSSSLEVLQARWHPGSPNDSHLLVLTSDNSFRLYATNAGSDAFLVNTWPLGRGPLGGITSSAKLPLLGGLGETAVDFDFGPPVLPAKATCPADKDKMTVMDMQWPIMVLRGNGDVYCVSASLTPKSKALVRGPLTMYPPADDNYGVDACSVLVLQTLPPLLVVATCAGTLYHCLLLSPEDGGDAAPHDLNESAPRLDSSKVWNTSSLAGQPVLHVFESVELELGLSLDDDLLEDASYNCPLHLQKHPTANDRYLVSHEAGIHILFLPIVSQLHKFVAASDDLAGNSLPKFDNENNSVAEYLLCTRVCGGTNGNTPADNVVPSPILGLALSSSPATLVALLAGGEIVSVLLSSLHLPSASSSSLLSLGGLAEMPKLHEEPFDEHICKLLKHRGTLPIFKFEEKAMSNPQEAFKLINRVTQLLYENYFLRHEQAHEDIVNRMKRLKRIKELQLADLSSLEKDGSELKSKAGMLADKLNELKAKQEELSDRSERALRNANMKQPVVSNAEMQMRKDLSQKQKALEEMKKKLENLKKFSVDQKTQLDRLNSSQKKRAISINESHLDVIKTYLKPMGEDLAMLQNKVRSCKSELEI